jgi:hypothetical protein
VVQSSYRKISRSTQWDNLDRLLPAHFSIPAVDPALQLVQLLLDACKAHILPQPERGNTHDGIQPRTEGEGIKGGD